MFILVLLSLLFFSLPPVPNGSARKLNACQVVSRPSSQQIGCMSTPSTYCICMYILEQFPKVGEMRYHYHTIGRISAQTPVGFVSSIQLGAVSEKEMQNEGAW